MQVKKAKPGKEAKAQLGVAEAKLGAVIQEETGIPCVCNEMVGEVLRGVRLHATRFLKGLEQDADLRRSQLGLAHSYSRAKVRAGAACGTRVHLGACAGGKFLPASLSAS